MSDDTTTRAGVGPRRQATGWLVLGLLLGGLGSVWGLRHVHAGDRLLMADVLLLQMAQGDELSRAHRSQQAHLADRTLALLDEGRLDDARRELVDTLQMYELRERWHTPIDVSERLAAAERRLHGQVDEDDNG